MVIAYLWNYSCVGLKNRASSYLSGTKKGLVIKISTKRKLQACFFSPSKAHICFLLWHSLYMNLNLQCCVVPVYYKYIYYKALADVWHCSCWHICHVCVVCPSNVIFQVSCAQLLMRLVLYHPLTEFQEDDAMFGYDSESGLCSAGLP